MAEEDKALVSTLQLIAAALTVGGELTPIALRTLAALRASHTDAELSTLALELNQQDEQKLDKLIARLQP